MKKKIIHIYIILMISIPVFAQNNTGKDIRLAHEYYRSKDYDKAEILFKSVYNKTQAKIYFSYFTNCLIEQSKFELAEKEIKKQIRKHKSDPSYLIDLGYLFKKRDDLESANNQFEKALSRVYNKPASIRSLASGFMQRQEYDFAEKTYLKGRKITNEDFRSELANLYAIQRQYDKMVNEYLDLLDESIRNLSFVQNRMQNFLNRDINDEFSDIIRKELLKRIQRTNSSIVFNKMLIWYYMQRKEFSKALFQEIAIDKRINSSGKRILDLAETAKSNDDYETAVNAYNYIIEKGRNKAFYIGSRVGKLNVYFLQVKNGTIKSNEEILNLEEEYLSTLNSLGIGYNTIQSVLDLAHLQTFYLNKPDDAESLLNSAMNLRGLDLNLVTKCKIELADVLVYQNNLDLAALIYGQAEKDNKDNMLGDIAKLKKAKLAYYANRFIWAKAQFDALKASTSKPVANDALFYSILIDDNTEGDSLQKAMKTFARAELLVFRNKKSAAVDVLDSLIENNPGHQLTDEAYFLKATIYEDQKNYEQAIEYYKKIISEFAWDILADVAIFKLAVLYEEKIKNYEEAAEYYKKLMLEHPDSIYVTEARKRFRIIRDENI